MDILKDPVRAAAPLPLLLVAYRVVEVVKGDHIHAYKNVTFNDGELSFPPGPNTSPAQDL